MVSVSVIVPANPFTAVRVMVEADDCPGGTVEGDVAVIRKSWKLNVAAAVCIRPPLLPVMRSMYVPATFELQETEAVPDVAMLAGEIVEQDRPVGGPLESLIAPAKLFFAAMVIVELADKPTLTPGEELAVIV